MRHAGRTSRSFTGRLRRGFTLIETCLATMIVGLGITALMALTGALTTQNAAAGQTTTAMLLASHVQEAMAGLSFNDPAYATTYFGPEPGESLASFNDVDDFDGQVLNPPIDAARLPIAALGQYSQSISVVPVSANKPSNNTNPSAPDLPKTTYTGVVRVTVKILYKRPGTKTSDEVYRTSWIRSAS
jgi:type II secretory pathway pseudopilin PulG